MLKSLPIADNITPKELIARKIRSLLPNGCARILLIQVPQVPENDFDARSAKLRRYPASTPYGPGLLCASLKRQGYETALIDLNYEILVRAGNPDFSYLVWQKVLEDKIEAFKPDLVGISCMFSTTHSCMVKTADYLKREHPEIPIIAGGVHPSGTPELTMKTCESIDFIMRYESENSFGAFVDIANNKCSHDRLTQTVAKIEGRYVEIEQRDIPQDLDLMPEYHDLPIGIFSSLGPTSSFNCLLDRPVRAAPVLANKGCRAHCTFCSVENFNGRGVRVKTAETVVEEIRLLNEKYGINHIAWLDDDLFFNEQRTINILRGIANLNLGITWEAPNGVIASATTEEIMQAASESGCIALGFGIESGNSEILKAVRKPSGVKHFLKIGELMKKYPKIFGRGFLMVGFPGETISQIRDTVNLARTITLDWCAIQIVIFLGNTAMGKEMLERGMITEDSLVDAPFFASVIGKQHKRENEEKDRAKEFYADILDRDGAYVPSEAELADIWFIMDYLINYEPILRIENPIKLRLKYLMLKDICDRKTVKNPLGTMFLGIVEWRSGLTEQARTHFREARIFMTESAFWNVRFKVLKLDKLLDEWTEKTAQTA